MRHFARSIFAMYQVVVTVGIFLFMVSASPSSAAVKVLTSIKPLGLIVNEVTGNSTVVDVLLPGNASPHDYPMKISDMRRITEADIVVWVGPTMETFLVNAVKNIHPTHLITAIELPGINWPHAKDGKDGGHKHDRDPHLWLDPGNAVVIANVIAQKLGDIEPQKASLYRNNANQFALRMKTLDEVLMRQLEPVRKEGFAVYHEGYQHFVERYQLNQIAYITLTPEKRPGARHLYMLRKQLENNASCLFTEAYYDTSMASGLAQELGLKVATLDPIGGMAVNSYNDLMNRIAEVFLACLTH